MNKLNVIAVTVLALVCIGGFDLADSAEPLSLQEAIEAAENFIRGNGYTNASGEDISSDLNYESIERAESDEEILQLRHNTLQPKAIGARRLGAEASSGWSAAFDYVDDRELEICRVVTMDHDGSNIRVQHQDGIRQYWAGFNHAAE